MLVREVLRDYSIDWAIQFCRKHGDGDLFPNVPEIQVIANSPIKFKQLLLNSDLAQLQIKPTRRFVIPKDQASFRQATNLHPQDSVLLAAIIFQYGSGIECRRLADSRVFSYRFGPTINNGLYKADDGWSRFWNTAKTLGEEYQFGVYCDISDFYNQIYHHPLENQLIESGFPNSVTKWILKLLEATNAGVSRGVPVGPHAVHLLAEASLVPIDNSLTASGIVFIRYVDDIMVFCDSEADCRSALQKIASTLDDQQRLMLQRHKTKIMPASELWHFCDMMLDTHSPRSQEVDVLGIVRKYTGGSPYRSVAASRVSPQDWNQVKADGVRSIVLGYLRGFWPDYTRIKWLYRRLSQIGHPAALQVTIEQFENLIPCLPNVCAYLGSIQLIGAKDWLSLGEKLIAILEIREVSENEFFRLSILSLFSRSEHINHFAKLAAEYQRGDPSVRREIILAARVANAIDWIRELKVTHSRMDDWQRMALLFAASSFPPDERRFFLRLVRVDGPFEEALRHWSNNPS